METVIRDLRHADRTLVKGPGFTGFTAEMNLSVGGEPEHIDIALADSA